MMMRSKENEMERCEMTMKNIIFDTDLGCDCDDVMALDLLLAGQRSGDCRLLAVTSSLGLDTAAPCIRAICRQHGCGDMLIGRTSLRQDPDKDCYATAVANAFPAAGDYVDSVKLLRKLLAEYRDVTVVVTGYLTNVTALLQSPADELSPLDGMELVRQSVREFAIMGGAFSHENGYNPIAEPIINGRVQPHAEWNIVCGIPEAQYFFTHCPVPAVLLPYETGLNMISGGPMRRHGERRLPDSLAFTVHGSMNGRHSWDPATALYAVWGAAPWFYQTVDGTVKVDDTGVTRFVSGQGQHSILLPAMSQQAIAADMDDKVMKMLADEE